MIVHSRSEHARGAAAARHLQARARRYLAALGQEDVEVSVLLVGDASIRQLNRTWRGRDHATDVLSFPQGGAPSAAVRPRRARARTAREPIAPLGDIVISLETAERVARRAGRSVRAELDRYLAHGLLHLLGHDHHRARDARRMAEAEDALVGEGMVSKAAGVRRGGAARRAARVELRG